MSNYDKQEGSNFKKICQQQEESELETSNDSGGVMVLLFDDEDEREREEPSSRKRISNSMLASTDGRLKQALCYNSLLNK